MIIYFKTLREPLIEQQTRSDEKQDKVIEQLKDNQDKIVKALEYDPQKAITESDAKIVDGVPFVNLDKGITVDYKKLLEEGELYLPSEIFEKKMDVDEIIEKIEELKEETKKFIKVHSTKKGQPSKKLSFVQKSIYDANIKKKIEKYNDYLERLNDIKKSKKYMGEVVRRRYDARRYKQPKRNAYKLQDNHYGGLLIDVPELMNRVKLNAYRGGKLIYEADADKSVIDLLTKRFNPKTKYSMNAVKIFNDLNMLSNMPPHKSSAKSRMVGSSVMYYQDPASLVDRMKILIGSMVAGNNSPVLRHDPSQINDELLKIGAIDRVTHEKFYNKYLE